MSQALTASDFGARALPRSVEALRGLADRMPANRAGGWGVSLLRRLCLAMHDQPCDVALFGSQRARLYPRDNRCEKRAFAGAHLWDGAERAYLDGLIAGDGFVFVDAGANVGLYTLSVRATALARGVPLTALAIEPDPVNAARLRFNLAASGAGEVRVAQVALSDVPGTLRLASAGQGNRGEVRADASGDVEVPARPLLDVVRDAGLARIDALKMDIEGMETAVLEPFLAGAPVSLLPRVMVLEVGREGRPELTQLAGRHGYRPLLRTRINTILGLAQNDE
jgi:FkbM family methyltransferase